MSPSNSSFRSAAPSLQRLPWASVRRLRRYRELLRLLRTPLPALRSPSHENPWGHRLVLRAKPGAGGQPRSAGRFDPRVRPSVSRSRSQEVRRSPKFPSLPCEHMPRSQTPATQRLHRPSEPSVLPSGRCKPSASTTLQISGLHHAACVLAPPGFAPRLAATHAGLATDLRTGFGRVGLSPTGRR
jgi:hypothetical protein